MIPPHSPEASLAVGGGADLGLTSTQREALEWLKAKRDAHPDTKWNSGFNPPTGRRAEVAAMRQSLARRGLVRVDRISDSHFRYDITEAGRLALANLSPSSQREG